MSEDSMLNPAAMTLSEDKENIMLEQIGTNKGSSIANNSSKQVFNYNSNNEYGTNPASVKPTKVNTAAYGTNQPPQRRYTDQHHYLPS
jgi:hypothetical protein